MDPTTKKHVSHWISWAIIALAVGLAAFGIWRYYDEIVTIYDDTIVASVSHKKAADSSDTTAADTTAAADWLTYTNETFGYSIQYPKDLSYVESSDKKNVYFQTAAEKAAAAACAARTATDCVPGKEIYIDVDANAGTTNPDDLTATIKAIVDTRVSRMMLNNASSATILGGQTAYEGVRSIMISDYNLITKYNNHVYDLTINCDEAVASATEATMSATCKAAITANQQKMINSFTFL